MAFMYPHHLPGHPFYEDFLNFHELIDIESEETEETVDPSNKVLCDERNSLWAPRTLERGFDNTSMSMRLSLPNHPAINDESSNHSLDDSQQFRPGDFTDEASQSNDDGEEEMELDSRDGEDDDDV